MPRNLPLFLSGNYLNFLRAQAETLQAAACCLPDMVAVFADSAGENEKIYSLEQGNVGANRFSNGNREDIQRKTCASVSARNRRFHSASSSSATSRLSGSTCMYRRRASSAS